MYETRYEQIRAQRRRRSSLVVTGSLGSRPDRAAYWALVLAVFMIILAVVSA